MSVTSIQWTDRTVNPIRARNKATGAVGHFCEKVSPGCANCYASDWNERVRPSGKHLIGTGLTFDVRNRDQIEFFIDDSKLHEVLKRRQPTKWFWCDMTDLFGEWVSDEWIDRCFAVMALTPQHTHQVLTKRADRQRTYMEFRTRPGSGTRTHDVLIAYARELGVDDATAVKQIGLSKWPLPNVWLGVSAEDQQRADERIPLLLQTPAAVGFVSAEPLLSALSIERWLKRGSQCDCGIARGTRDGCEPSKKMIRCNEGLKRLSWVIVGGESGTGARPMDLAWPRSIVQQCKAAGVACFVKQLGAEPFEILHAPRPPQTGKYGLVLHDRKGGDPSEWPEDIRVREWPEVRA